MVTYGSEAWTINKEILNKINAFECWIYRRVLKISWTDKFSNKELLQRIRIRMHLMNSIAKRKAVFFGHICRCLNGNDVVTILEGSVEGIRSRGAQRRKWSDNVTELLNITDYGSLKRTSDDRGYIARIQKTRIGSGEGNIMGLCYGAHGLLPCIV